ncbi:ABC transporter ATP-binding protein [Pararhizobium qamdonense]|uniref:ABC transporter ATP-binding protein n=1 Tax=Pararhizobium qamdonense TaxID=3031126 RepID=UPI0023E33D82|nr:ABC transporter ATP-binding protein [Pararhizobium qamdonense]
MLEIQNISKTFGGVKATQNVSLIFPEGSLSAVIGPNGAGKTTLFNQITGRIRPDSGKIIFEDHDLVGQSSLAVTRAGVVRAFQVAALFPTLTVRESLAAAVTSRQKGSWDLFARFPAKPAETRADEIAEMLGMSDRRDILSKELSHGDQKLLDIGLALALDPKVLLLDEPTAGMGPDERWRMIDKVHALWKTQGLTIVFIEHDMDIVFKIAQTIHVLCYGALLASGTADEIRRNQKVVDAYLGAEHHSVQGAKEVQA